MGRNGVYTTLVKTQLTHQPENKGKRKKQSMEKVEEVQEVESNEDDVLNEEI